MEDIFVLKLIANRPQDIDDCVAIASSRMDYDAIYS